MILLIYYTQIYLFKYHYKFQEFLLNNCQSAFNENSLIVLFQMISDSSWRSFIPFTAPITSNTCLHNTRLL